MLPTRRYLLSRGWTPKSIAGLRLWFDLATQSGYAADAPVGQLDDKSGLGNHFTQGTESLQPLYKTAQQNGLPGLLFDGTDDYLDHTTLTLPQPRTFIAVGKYTGGVGESRFIIDGASSFTSSVMQHIATKVFRITAGTALDYTASDDTLPFVWTVIFNGTSSFSRWNSNEVSGNAGSTNPTGFRLGRAGGAVAGYWKGYIFEVLGYNWALSSGEYLRLEAYLKPKWGISY
jgi:hypothetical protein